MEKEFMQTHRIPQNVTPSTIVLKLGTSSIINPENNSPFMSNLSRLVELVAYLRAQKHRVILVSSGAIGLGMKRINLSAKPKRISQIQAVAAIGQGRLMSMWDSLFSQFDIPIAQILLTKENISNRQEFLNASQTVKELLAFEVVPIINENDTISTEEIRIGDNDTLSAYVAGMINADWLFLLTDVECLYNDNPRTNKQAKPIRIVDNIRDIRNCIGANLSAGSGLGTGGMETKLVAAELATSAGCKCVILASRMIDSVTDILAGNADIGTTFLAKSRVATLPVD